MGLLTGARPAAIAVFANPARVGCWKGCAFWRGEYGLFSGDRMTLKRTDRV
jgi:hypothetical protein